MEYIVQKFWKLWKKADKTYLLYTSFFIVLCEFFLFLFSYYGKSLVWYSDGLTQSVPNLIYLREWVREIVKNLLFNHRLVIPTWDMSIGLGEGIFSTVGMRPSSWLFVFWPNDSVESYYQFRTVISMYLSGIFFIVLCKKREFPKINIVFASICYVFSTYALVYCVRQPMFFDFFMYFPLMCFGIERILKKEKPTPFIVAVFLLGISYFYSLYFMTIFAFIYAVIRYWNINKKIEIKPFFQTVLYTGLQYLKGIGLACFVIIPLLLKAANSGRGDNNAVYNLIAFSKTYYVELFSNIVDNSDIGSQGYLGLYTFIIISIIYIVMKWREEKIAISVIGAGAISLLIPLCSFVLNGFAGINQRWLFIFTFAGCYLIACNLNKFLKLTKQELFRFLCIASVVIGVLFAWKLYTADEDFSGLVFLLILLIVIMVANVFRLRKKTTWLLLLTMLVVETGYKMTDIVFYEKENQAVQYVDQGGVDKELTNSAISGLQIDVPNNVRVDAIYKSKSSKYKHKNYGYRAGLNGFSSYFSLTNSNVINFVNELGNSQLYGEFLIFDFDNRAALYNLGAVEYVVSDEVNNYWVPYGYEKIDETEVTYPEGNTSTVETYQNTHQLPLAYAYTSTISKDTWGSLSLNQREQAFLQGAVVEEKLSLPETTLNFDSTVLLTTEQIKEQLLEMYPTEKNERQAIEVYDDKFIVKVANAKMTFTIPKTYNSETYFNWTGAEFVGTSSLEYEDYLMGKNSKMITIRTFRKKNKFAELAEAATFTTDFNGVKKDTTLLASSNQYFVGEKDVLVNLGYAEENNETITIRFSGVGEYYYDDLEIVSQPMDNFTSYIDEIKSNGEFEVEIENGNIYCDAKMNKDGVACIAVPFDVGWTVYVDGEETDSFLVNEMYTGIMLSEGLHKIEMVYRTPGLNIGILISVVTVLVLFSIVILKILIKKRGKRSYVSRA